MAIAAQSASTVMASTSAGPNSPPAFSVRYRLPQASPRITSGTPRNVVIGGCPCGKP